MLRRTKEHLNSEAGGETIIGKPLPSRLESFGSSMVTRLGGGGPGMFVGNDSLL